jgi:uncharacterized surface protein with fasciclin (FAS1) repeats
VFLSTTARLKLTLVPVLNLQLGFGDVQSTKSIIYGEIQVIHELDSLNRNSAHWISLITVTRIAQEPRILVWTQGATMTRPVLLWKVMVIVTVLVAVQTVASGPKIGTFAFAGATRVNAIARRLQDSDITTVFEVAASQSDLVNWTAAATLAGLKDRLCIDCNYAVFAPIDKAFAKLNPKLWTKLLTLPWILHLRQVLANHVSTPPMNLFNGTLIPMLSMEEVTVQQVEDGTVKLFAAGSTNASTIVEASLLDDYSVLRKVDTVLLPSFVSKSLYGLLNTSAGSEFSVLANLFDLIGGESFLAAIGDEGVTVFAPTDAAFNALGNETVANLMNDTDQLTRILSNHVIVGIVPSVSITDGQVNASLGGLELAFSSFNGSLMVNNASVVAADILANNGIVHAIDKVLLATPDPSPSPTPPKAAPVPAPTPGTATPPTGSVSHGDAAALVPIWVVPWIATSLVFWV